MGQYKSLDDFKKTAMWRELAAPTKIEVALYFLGGEKRKKFSEADLRDHLSELEDRDFYRGLFLANSFLKGIKPEGMDDEYGIFFVRLTKQGYEDGKSLTWRLGD